MQRTDVDLRTLAGSGKDAAQKMEDALARLLRQAATGADNCKHFDAIISCCEANQPPALRSCAFSLVPSCSLYEGDAWGRLVKAIVSEATIPPRAPPIHPHTAAPCCRSAFADAALAGQGGMLRRDGNGTHRRLRRARACLSALRLAAGSRL